jgi:uncharacterized phage protein gp47/JayE
MPWLTPTLRNVRELVRDGVRGSLPGADASVPNSVLRVISDAMAALAHLTLQYIDWLARQLLPDSAETEFLDRHGTIWLENSDGSRGRKLASLASGSMSATGSNGAVIPLGTRLISAALRVGYETTETATMGGTATPVKVRALDPGAQSNLDSGSVITFDPPPAGIEQNGTIITMIGGADEESDEELRARVLLRIQQPPMGGSETDYLQWTLDVPGVSRAWCAPLEQGMGTVVVRFMMDVLRADNNGIPLADDVQAVADYLNSKRPVAVKDIFVVAPIPFPIVMNISELVEDTGSVRASIEETLQDMFLEKSIPGGTLYRSWVDAAISEAIGENHHELVYNTTAAPTPGHLPILGSIIYAG